MLTYLYGYGTPPERLPLHGLAKSGSGIMPTSCQLEAPCLFVVC